MGTEVTGILKVHVMCLAEYLHKTHQQCD